MGTKFSYWQINGPKPVPSIEIAIIHSQFFLFPACGGIIPTSNISAARDRIRFVSIMFNVERNVDLEEDEQRQIGAEQVDLALATILPIQGLLPKLLFAAQTEIHRGNHV